MFDDISKIDWANLSHAYGTCEDVPQKLAKLVDGNEEERGLALGDLWEHMLHQGSRYEASPYVVTFLFEMLEAVDDLMRPSIIDFLLSLGVGYAESFLPFGYDLEVEENKFKQDEWLSVLYSYENARKAYYEVHQRANQFIKFLQPEYDHPTRHIAITTVAHFAQPLASCLPMVNGLLSSETNEELQQVLLLCHGMLGRFAKEESDVNVVAQFLESRHSKTLQLAAAISLVTMDGNHAQAKETLLAALNESWEVNFKRPTTSWWNEGDLLGYAALSLRLIGDCHRDEIAEALCKLLVSNAACTHAVPETLLAVLFPRKENSEIWSVTEMDGVQKTSLACLLDTKHWSSWMLSNLFLSPGLTGEDYHSAMQKFFEEVMGEQTKLDSSDLSRWGSVSTWDLKHNWGIE